MSQNTVAVVIGRFQPFHNGHVELINYAFNHADEVIVLIGSTNAHLSYKNPFTFEERCRMIENEFPMNVSCRGIRDFPYNDDEWLAEVQHEISNAIHPSKDVVLVGHVKDGSSYYLSKFPQWAYAEAPNFKGLNATDFRNEFFDETFNNTDIISAPLPKSTKLFLDEYQYTKEFDRISEERDHIIEYHKIWDAAPYTPIFVTCDAVVICKGHVLLIQRKESPGKGMWAVPGGFINPDEKIIDGIFRELVEETMINLPPAILKNSLTKVEVFDTPDRSLRGRTITHAGLIELTTVRESLPKIKGADDADKAKWVPLDQARNLSETNQMFEDHYHIIETLIHK
jgi:bifunctional NMN adenylyltransferase/nudix hydrolase